MTENRQFDHFIIITMILTAAHDSAGHARRTIKLTHAVTQVGERIWLVTFMQDDWATSTTRRAGWNPWRIPSGRKCYPCLRNELLPMCPDWTKRDWLLRLAAFARCTSAGLGLGTARAEP